MATVPVDRHCSRRGGNSDFLCEISQDLNIIRSLKKQNETRHTRLAKMTSRTRADESQPALLPGSGGRAGPSGALEPRPGRAHYSGCLPWMPRLLYPYVLALFLLMPLITQFLASPHYLLSPKLLSAARLDGLS